MCRRLADSAGWQPSGTIKLPNNAMLDIYTYSGFNTISKASTSICIAPSMQDKGDFSLDLNLNFDIS